MSSADLPRPPSDEELDADLKALAPILLVDDNAGKRTALRAVLAPLGYPIVEADSGRAALRCLLARNFAVILLDVRMPMMDGFETAGLIRQRRQSETTPIIFITSYAIDELGTSDRYVEGAVDFMFAPVPPEELRAKVQVFLTLFTKAEGLASAAREVQTTADQLRLLTEAAPIGIFQTDSENRYVYTNPRWTEITGIPTARALGRDWDFLEFPSGRSDPPEPTDNALPADVSRRFQMAVPGTSGRVVLLTSRAVPDLEGGHAGWVGTLADVTAEAGAEAAMSRARDKANEASQQKSDFLANMSHEIRTPMNGVIGMTDLLLETELDARQREYAQTVRNSGEALLIIIDEILDFSKVEAGELRIEEIEFDVAAILDDVVDLLASSARIKGLQLVSAIGDAVPTRVSGDPGRIRQVLTNLIGNAVKFTRTGGVTVHLTAPANLEAPTLLRFEVTDTGAGIPPDKLQAIFQPFTQVDSSTSRKYGGTGLGLTISSQLVGLMGGECGVSSEPGVGSTFWFTVRVGTSPNAAAPTPDPVLRGKRVLVVEGNAPQREVLAAYLTAWGMAVETTGSGRAALDLAVAAAAAGAAYDLTLIDRDIPGQDVLDLRDRVRTDTSLTAHVIEMSDVGFQDSLRTGRSSSARSSVLTKPIHREHLRHAVTAAVGGTADEVATATVTTATGRPGDSPQRGRILLAEDNAVNRKVAVAMLTGAGYEVDTVLDGVGAVAGSASGNYDAILMDCQMPEMNGYEATAAIRAREGADRHTPIIAMTAGARREDQERCLAEGMDSYLSKPVNKDTLLALVATAIAARSGVGAPLATVEPRA